MTDDRLIIGEMELPSEGFSFKEQRHPVFVVRPHFLPDERTAL